MNDGQVEDVLDAVHHLAILLRDDGPAAVRAAALAVLAAAGGDAAAALVVAAALIDIDSPVDTWWQHLEALNAEQRLVNRAAWRQRRDEAMQCGTPVVSPIPTHTLGAVA